MYNAKTTGRDATHRRTEIYGAKRAPSSNGVVVVVVVGPVGIPRPRVCRNDTRAVDIPRGRPLQLLHAPSRDGVN